LSSQSASEEFSTPVLSADRRIKAKKYARINRRLSFLEAVLSAALLLWLIFSGFSSEIVSFIGLPAVPAAVVYSLVLVVVYGVLSTPVNYYRGFVLARRYGLSNQGFAGWLGDSLQSGALTSILAISVVAIAYWAVGVLPELWWLVVWGFLLVVSLILSTLLPVVLIPMFYRTKPLEDETLSSDSPLLPRRPGFP